MKIVSVIMPCFNDGKYIEESIECVLSQTYKNIELIIIDDGSTDSKTIEIIENIKHNKNKKYGNIKILRTSGVGVAEARNIGVRNAIGEYILPLDSDDIIDKTYIEKAVKIMDSDEKIGIVYCKAELFGEKEGEWDLKPYSIQNILIDNVIFVTSLFRKKDWELVGGFDTAFKKGLEDYDFWLSIIELNRDVVQIQEFLFKYRIKKISRNKSFENNIEDIKKTYEDLYIKHRNLYMENIDNYIIAMRNLIIEENFKSKLILEKIKTIPLIGIVFKNDNLKKKIKSILRIK